MMNKRFMTRSALPRRSALAVALALGMGVAGMVSAQSTTGAIFGSAPQQSGETVVATSASGTSRTVSVTDGRYSLGDLPLGTYTVTLNRDGNTVSTRKNVRISVGRGTQINFAAGSGENAQELGTVVVLGNALPTIDVTSVTSTFTLDAAQLKQLPLGHSADSIALLSPGTTAGSNYFGGISFGGAGVTENAYYVNGYNTTGLYNYTGSAYDLPYGAIAQQQNITGGYSAKYGRADGGVINQVGKRGTNEWHFGARIQWVPRSLRASPRNVYYPDVQLKGKESFSTYNPETGKDSIHNGELQRYRNVNKGWDENISAYIGGALVQDKLFFFVAGEADRQRNRSNGSVAGQTDNYYKNHSMNWYGKIDWNINDSNLFEYTYLMDTERNGYGETFRFDPDTQTDVRSLGANAWDVYTNKTQIFHYTGYLSDNATLSVLYGKTRVANPSPVPNPSKLPYISGGTAQRGGQNIINDQTLTQINSPDSAQQSNGLRVDFSYQLGDHKLSAGIDNLHYWAEGQGVRTSGPGYLWIYGKAPTGGTNITPVLNVGAPGGSGYFVQKYKLDQFSGMSARQKAWYVQDEWQITPNVLVSLGYRNDSFQNLNPDGVPFVDQENQKEPRLGVSWDVFGDSSLKIYANAGRYFLALPQATANRQATASLFTHEYFTYAGIDDNGEPQGLTPVATVGGVTGTDPGPGPVSQNNEFGQLPDPKLVAALNLKPQYQDEFIVGFDKKLGDKWVYGAKVTYRTLGTLIDDGCYGDAIANAITKQGLDPANYDVAGGSCHLFNPNRTALYKIAGAPGSGTDPIQVSVSPEDAGLPDSQRDYYALNLYLEHPFDGKWMGRVDYTFSRSWGNSEGQVRSDIGQGDISLTEDWDYAELMSGARGYLANNIRHQLKAYGAWQMTPEWMLSGTLSVLSGRPVSCLGFYGPTPEDGATNNPGGAYGSDYHWCEGKIATPGATSTSWTKQLDLGITYSPAFADHKLNLKAYVFNVLNEQKAIQLQPHRFSRNVRTVSHSYGMPLYHESPRFIRFTVSYDY